MAGGMDVDSERSDLMSAMETGVHGDHLSHWEPCMHAGCSFYIICIYHLI